MQIDKSQFPLVFLRETHDPGSDVEAGFAALLGAERPFVLIARLHSHDTADETQEAKKARARFFKQNQARLRTLCAAAIVIEGEEPAPIAFRLAAQGLGKAFGVPFHFVRDEAAATVVGRGAMAQHSG